jgi:hypothetical protein
MAKPSGEHTRLGGFVSRKREWREMPKGWSFKDDRRVMELAKASKTLEQIAKTMNCTPARIRKVAMRLGVSVKSTAKANR